MKITDQHQVTADAAQAAHDRSLAYGAYATNPLDARNVAIRENARTTVTLDHPDLVEVTRLRLLTDPGCPFWDVSYCYGSLRDGTPVRVDIGVYQLPRFGYKRELVKLAKASGKYAIGLGLLDNISTLH